MSVKTFFERVETEFKRLFGSTKWESTTLSVINYAAPLVETLATLAAGPAAGTALTGVLNQVKAGLATVSAVVSGAITPTPANELATAKQALASVQANLNAILTDADIKNDAHFADISAVATLILNEVGTALSGLA